MVPWPCLHGGMESGTGSWPPLRGRGRRTHRSVSSARQAIRAFDQRWLETVSGPIAGSVDLLSRIRENGIPDYAITNFSHEKFPIAKAHFPFLEGFRGTIVSGEEKLLKPEPEIYRLLLDRYGLEAADCVFIDDSPANVEGARAVGMHAVHFTGPEPLATDLRRLGFAV